MAITSAQAAPVQRAGKRGWAALAVLMLPVLTVSIDNTALVFAVPQLTMALQPTGAQMLWVLDIYPLILAALLLTMGMLGDRWGRRLLLMVGSMGFAVCSVLAAFSPDAMTLILARAALGFFGAMLMPSTLSLLRNIFADPHERRLAIAVWSAGFAGGGAVGPIVGGWLLEHWWWGAIFLISVPPCLILVAAAPFLLPESRNDAPGRLDILSVLLSVGAMLPFVFAVKHVAAQGFDEVAGLALVTAVVLGAAFIWRQLRRANPLLDLRLFTSATFSAAMTANFISVFAFAGLLYVISQHLQFVMGRDPLEAATVLLPGALATVLAGFVAARLAVRVHPAVVVVGGLLISTGGYLMGSAIGVDSSVWLIVAMFAAVGAGAGLSETLTNDLIISSVPARRAGAASGISETAYELGSALGMAVLGSVLNWRYSATLELPEEVPGEVVRAGSDTIGRAMSSAGEVPAEVREEFINAVKVAFDHGVSLTSAVGMVLLLVTALGVAATFAWTARREAR